MPQILVYPKEVETSLNRYTKSDFMMAGNESFSGPTSATPDGYEKLINIQPIADGAIYRRWGYKKFADYNGGRNSFEFRNDSASLRALVFASQHNVMSLLETGASHNPTIFTPSSGADTPYMVNSRDFGYFADGVAADLIKWNGAVTGGTSSWGFVAPTTNMGVADGGAGSITLLTGRTYFLIFENSTTGATSDLGPASASTGPLTARRVNITALEVSTNPQVDKKILLATGDGGDQTVLYFVAELANAVTTYTDNTPEDALLQANVYQETDDLGFTHGVADNIPPPTTAKYPIRHQGRIWMLDGHTLVFSKNLDEVTTSSGLITGRYEEAFPGDNQIDVAGVAETPIGLISDGRALYIGTERHIRRLTGDSPNNFNSPDVVFNEVGVLNIHVWKVVFIEGQPIGLIWISPDKRIIFSDYNFYRDIGTPIQDQINQINSTTAAQNSRAWFVSGGQFDCYMLAVPTGTSTECNKLFVFNLATKKWLVWNLTDNIRTLLFNINSQGIPHWIFGADTSKAYVFDETLTQDRVNDNVDSVIYPVQIKSNWMDFGDPSVRKILNEVEIVTDDTELDVTLTGASFASEFNTPNTIREGPLVKGPFGEYKLYLASARAHDRYYKLDMVSHNESNLVLSSFNFEIGGIHRV